MSGRAGDLSPKQEKALAQLKENVKDVTKSNWDDHLLLRFLRARAFDVKKSEKMLRENVEWRRRTDADRLPDWEPPEALARYYPGGQCGEDRDGNPVMYDALGYMDIRGMVYSVPKKDIVKYTTKLLEIAQQETFPEQSKKHGKNIEQFTLIYDMDHIGRQYIWKPALDMYTDILSTFEANYPETMKVSYIINAPKIFPILWNIAKPFLHEDTRKKIKILGKNYKAKLVEKIDPDQLIAHYGGNMRDPDGDEFCKSKFCIGGKIPERYNMKNIRENLDMSNFEKCTVQKGSSVQLEYDVTEPGSSIRWQFLSEGNDIGFGIFRRTSDARQKKGDMEEVVRSDRINSHLVPEEGNILVDQPGTYVVRFDNTYSWVNAKKIDYCIEVLLPDKENELEITEF